MKSERRKLAKEQQKKKSEELRKRNIGIGLTIVNEPTVNPNNKKTVFDWDMENVEEQEEKPAETKSTNEEGSDDDDSEVEEVAGKDARMAAETQRSALKLAIISTHRKTKKRRRLRVKKVVEDENLDDDMLALLDADRAAALLSCKPKTSNTAPITVGVPPGGKRTTFLVGPPPDNSPPPVNAGNNISVVILNSENASEPMGYNIGVPKPSNVALMLSRTGDNLIQGLKRSKKQKYGSTMRGRPCKVFSINSKQQ
jgi:hypothetical protein